MSTPNPTHTIAEGMREVATEGQKGTPGTRDDGQLWGAFPNTMTIKDLAAHVVSKLTDAGYSIVPTPTRKVTDKKHPPCQICGKPIDMKLHDIKIAPEGWFHAFCYDYPQLAEGEKT